MNNILFHLAFPVNNLVQTKEFYVEGLGCPMGRETNNALILNLYEHQIVAHISQEPISPQKGIYPRHFGLIFLIEKDWQDLLNRAEKKELKFCQKPKTRFSGTPIEHHTFLLEDPFFNLLEFKLYYRHEAIFGSTEQSKIGDYVEEAC